VVALEKKHRGVVTFMQTVSAAARGLSCREDVGVSGWRMFRGGGCFELGDVSGWGAGGGAKNQTCMAKLRHSRLLWTALFPSKSENKLVLNPKQCADRCPNNVLTGVLTMC
jgi:hypothetical protein